MLIQTFFAWGLFAPEAQEFLKIAGTAGDLAGDGAVEGNAGIGDVFQDFLVGGRRATNVVLGLQTVDGDDDVQALELLPMGRNDAECAGDDLDVDSTALEFGDDELQLAMADQWVASDKGDMERLEFVYYLEDVAHQLAVLVIR